MKPIQDKILLPLVLALMFFISNVGLPIVLVACPVMENRGIEQSCCQDQTNQLAVKLSAFSTSSCCEKTVAAPPLKFESTELKSTVSTAQKFKVEFAFSAESVVFTSTSPIVSLGISSADVLLPARESYLFTSSLRI
jgi:hypothetical protein